MKNIYKLSFLMLFSLAAFYSCQEDDQEFGEVVAPTNLTLDATVLNTSAEFPNGDGGGLVSFAASADDVITFEYRFDDGTSSTTPSGEITHPFTRTGTNTYNVTVIAKGTGGASSSTTKEVTVFTSFDDPIAKMGLTGANQAYLDGTEGPYAGAEGDSIPTKVWRIADAMPGHLSLGPAESTEPIWYSAAPFEKEGGCFYDDRISFALNLDGDIIFEHDNNGQTFFNTNYLNVGGGTNGTGDECFDFDTSGEKPVSLAAANSIFPEDATTGTQMIISDGGFMSYYLGTNNGYEILEITDDYLYIRTISGANPAEAWYLKLTAEGDSAFETEFPGDSEEEAAWSQEFEGSSLDTSIWNYEIGNGDNGWGNGEAQYYTDQNTEVSNGTLKINAIAEPTNGYNYSSARITTQDNFEFQYGRIEVRAKLPSAGGTWPAIWMLGENFDTVSWPNCGEIDIMEHVGNDLGEVLGTLHFPGNFGGSAVSQGTDVENVATEFHKYTMEWTEDHIVFLVDGEVYHEFTNMAGTPFVDHEFFLILNVAMGGTLGGTIDPAFTQDTMEIDYVRVYQ